jgi:phage terminase large subunit
LVCRRYATTLRNSCFALFKEVLEKWKLTPYVKIRETDMTIIFPNGSTILMCGLDTEEKLLSLTNISVVWCEEVFEIEKEKVEQLNLRMRGEAANQQIILSWNPISKSSYLYDFTVENPPANSIFHHSTYKDNPFLNDEYV